MSAVSPVSSKMDLLAERIARRQAADATAGGGLAVVCSKCYFSTTSILEARRHREWHEAGEPEDLGDPLPEPSPFVIL